MIIITIVVGVLIRLSIKELYFFDTYLVFKNNYIEYPEMVNLLLKRNPKTGAYEMEVLSLIHISFSTIYLEIEEGNEYEEEMALICEEMIKQRLEGMKNYKGQEIGEAFPKLVYLLDEHNCLEGGKYDYITKLAAECTAKRLVPDLSLIHI